MALLGLSWAPKRTEDDFPYALCFVYRESKLMKYLFEKFKKILEAEF
jgi:hypothetical protein